jgi:hypothetical protein
MKNKTVIGCGIVFLLLNASILFAQSSPAGLVGCIDGKGDIFNIFPKDVLGEACPAGSTMVDLGTVSDARLGKGLVGGVTAGTVDIGIDPMFAIPPACPPGQIALSDDNGGWVCTPPSLLSTPNTSATVWVIPSFFQGRNPANPDDPLRIRSAAAFVNPGFSETRIQGQAFDEDGNPVTLDNFANVIPSNGRRLFLANQESAWLLAVSCDPVFATAFDRISRREGSGGFQLEAYPVNCEGRETEDAVCTNATTFQSFVCQSPNTSCVSQCQDSYAEARNQCGIETDVPSRGGGVDTDDGWGNLTSQFLRLNLCLVERSAETLRQTCLIQCSLSEQANPR